MVAFNFNSLIGSVNICSVATIVLKTANKYFFTATVSEFGVDEYLGFLHNDARVCMWNDLK